MDEEQQKKWTELGKLYAEFRKKMDAIFPRDEHGNPKQNPRIISEAKANEVRKLAKQIEETLKGLLAP